MPASSKQETTADSTTQCATDSSFQSATRSDASSDSVDDASTTMTTPNTSTAPKPSSSTNPAHSTASTTRSAIEVLFSETIDIKIAALAGFTEAKDPDELLSQPDGVEIFNTVIDNAVDLLKWRFDRLRAELAGAGAARVTQRIEEEIRTLLDLGIEKLSPMRRQLMIRQIAGAAGVSEQVVTASIEPKDTLPPESNAPLTARELLLGCLLSDPKLWLTMSSEEHDLMITSAFQSRSSAMVAQALHESVENGTGTGLHEVLRELSETLAHTDEQSTADPVGRATLLCRTVEQQSEGSDERIARMMRECTQALALNQERTQPIHPPSDGSNDTDDLDQLRAFAAKQQSMRKKYGTMRGKLSGGDG